LVESRVARDRHQPAKGSRHEATSTGEMTHIAVTGDVDGTNVDWMEHVTDDEYIA
jgi:hypothetical protein